MKSIKNSITSSINRDENAQETLKYYNVSLKIGVTSDKCGASSAI